MAQTTLRRQTPEVGAVCGKAACTDLSGGHEVTRVPTAPNASSSCGSVRIDRLGPWLGRPEGGTSDRADEVTLSRKGANSPTRGRRSTGTKAKARVSNGPNSLIELKKQLEARARELAEAREQQTATSEVLKVISTSPGELEPVFNAMLENAVRICEAKFGAMYLSEVDAFRIVAMHNAPPAFAEMRRRNPVFRANPRIALARAAATKQTVQIADVQAEPGYLDPLPGFSGSQIARLAGGRTVVAVPLLKENELVGVIGIYRQEVRPFTEKQIELLTSFASQAVIAIENTRLLNELRQRTYDLSESLEQQTATSEVLRVISSSSGELKPVFEAMLANATRLCGANFGNLYLYEEGGFRTVASHNVPPAYAEARRRGLIRPVPGGVLCEVIRTKQTVHLADLAATQGYAERHPLVVESVEVGGVRTTVCVPMLNDNELVGAIVIFRQEVRPFTDKQIALLTNFASQAVIAIENTRLLNELRESLQQQTATADVLKVISSAPGELQPVFDAMLANVTRLCEAKFASLLLREGDQFRRVSLHNAPPALTEHWRRTPLIRPHPESAVGRAALTMQVAHIDDITTSKAYRDRDPILVAGVELGGYRTVLSVPMLKDQELVGLIVIYRQEVRAFSDKQIELVQNFANQAVIAIENTRLLNELRESLQQQTATAEVLKVISNSPGALTPVFDAMLQNAVSICEAKFGTMFRFDGDVAYVVAMLNLPPALDEHLRQRGRRQPAPGSDLEKVLKLKQVIHTID